jgi:dihydrofolate reductase
MNPNIILYIASSIDGFIARKDGSVDWLSSYEQNQEDVGYEDFYKTIGIIIMGHTTYKQILTFGNFPYKEKKCYVFTKDKHIKEDENVTFVSTYPEIFIEHLKRTETENIWLVGGASIVAEFLKNDLIDEFIITLVPIFLGEGIPFFKEYHPEKQLKLVNIKSFNSGLVQLRYERIR